MAIFRHMLSLSRYFIGELFLFVLLVTFVTYLMADYYLLTFLVDWTVILSDQAIH